MKRSYSELRHLNTFEERYLYLQLKGDVGRETFGFDRYMNQQFYTSRAWRRVRDVVITRDNGCDLGVAGYEIHDKIIIHHITPIRPVDIEQGDDDILDPEFLISTTLRTHNAIHFGDKRLLATPYTPRRIGDTRLW